MLSPDKIQIASKYIVGISTRTANKNELNPKRAELPGLWSRFYMEEIAAKIPYSVVGSPTYGVYSEYKTDLNGPYKVTAGLEVEQYQSGDAFDQVIIKEGYYLVFKRKGILPQIVIDTWGDIWRYFAINSQCQRAYETDFELYLSQCEVAIHISVI